MNNYPRFNAVGTVVRGSCQLDMTRWCDINKLTIIVCVEPGAGDAWKRRRQALEDGCPHRRGTFNPDPGKVRDPKFRGSEFFDPHDAVQVKYEMLRRVSVDKLSVTEASDEYGVSRPTYYQTKANFDLAGVAGLVPARPGPRGPHKVDAEVLAFLQARLVPGAPCGRANCPSWSARNSRSRSTRGQSSGF